MKKFIPHRFLSLALMLALALSGVSAFAQLNSKVHGVALDAEGKPIVGATVQMVNVDNGRKFTMKTDKKGEFLSIAISSGKYNTTLIAADGKTLTTANNFPVDPSLEVNELDFNLKKETEERQAQATGQKPVDTSKLTPEQKAQLEAIQKQNEQVKQQNAKIGSLNTMLKEATADLQAKNYDAAMALMKQATAADPNQPLLWGRLGDAESGSKQYKDCATSYSKAIDLETKGTKPNPQVIGAWYNGMGACQAKAGDVPGAVQSFDKSAQTDPAQAGQAYFNEGAVLTNLGKADDANAAFDKAIAADPNRADAYYQKGVNLTAKATTDKSGKIVPAPGTTEALQKYLELDPTGKYAQGAKDLLASFGETVQTSFGTKAKSKKK